MDPQEFLLQYAPFSQLEPERLAQLTAALQIEFLEAGAELFPSGGEALDFIWVIRKGQVALQHESTEPRLLDVGDCVGFPSVLSKSPPKAGCVAQEDCLLYRLPSDVFRSILAQDTGFARFFMDSLAGRLRHREGPYARSSALTLSTSVQTLIVRDAVLASDTICVGDAAKRMQEAGVSSLLLTPPEDPTRPHGILTDRDLRRRVLAQGRGPETPVRDVMSTPLRCASDTSTIFEAMMKMMELRIHHLPLEDAEHRVRGVITHDDLLRNLYYSPGSFLKQVQRLKAEQISPRYGEQVSGMVEQLMGAGLDPLKIGQMVASVNDALIDRLIVLAQRELGPAPLDFAWIVYGSEGRMEQALLTDQDNALIYEDPETKGYAPDVAKKYFDALAKWVVGRAVDAGIPPCKGNFMATHWCQPLSKWCAMFRSWGDVPSPDAVMQAANFLDFRRLQGSLNLLRLENETLDLSKNERFMAQFARQCLDKRPQLGILSRWFDRDRSVDLKAEGLVPIVGLGRIYALRAGQRPGSTLARLAAATKAGLMESSRSESLGEAFRFIFRLRLEFQLRALRGPKMEGGELRLRDLSPLDRRHLKDCFRQIEEAQASLQRLFRVDMLG